MITLTIKRHNAVYYIEAMTEIGPQSWSRSRNLPVTRMKAYLLARRIYQRTNRMVRVVEDQT